MVKFTREDSDFSRRTTRQIRLDSKGRVSIPADIRRSMGIEEGDVIKLIFDIRSNSVFIFLDRPTACEGSQDYGQNGVIGSTEGCGKPFRKRFNPKLKGLQRPSSPGSNLPFLSRKKSYSTKKKAYCNDIGNSVVGNPGSDPKNKEVNI